MNTIITDKIVFGGNCLSKIDGKNIFIPYAIPGEKLEIEITESKKDYSFGKIINILEKSPYRIEPVCPLYTKCGGCNMMHIDFNHQVELRKQILNDCLVRNDINAGEIKAVTGNPLNYRARFQLHDGSLVARNSNEKISLTNCPVAENPVNDYLKNVPEKSRAKGRCHLFGSSKANPQIVVTEETIKTDIAPKNKKIKHQVRKIYQGNIIDETKCVQVELLGKKLLFDARGFFQSNLEVLEKTIQLVKNELSGNLVLDMYSGCGTFSVFLAENFNKVILVEHNKAAIVFAEQNLSGINHESYAVSGAKWVKENAESVISRNGSFDAVFIDPPRSGMENEVRNFLIQLKTPKIVLLSCDPSTASRDIKALTENGYKIKQMYLLDYYPQTSHIESLCILQYDLDFNPIS